MKKILLAAALLMASPFAASAVSNLTDFVTAVTGWVGVIIPLIITISMLFFFWGLLKYFLSGGDEAEKEKSKDFMIWGVVVLFVMASLWGLVAFLQNTVGITGTVTFSSVNVPTNLVTGR